MVRRCTVVSQHQACLLSTLRVSSSSHLCLMTTEAPNPAPGSSRSDDEAPRPTDTTVLATLLRERNWHRYGVFRVEYERAARSLDRALVATTPSRAQWHRWLAGELRRLPYVDHCRVLEAMFPRWTAERLLSPVGEEATSPRADPDSSVIRLLDLEPERQPLRDTQSSGTYADLIAAFPTRTEFMANMSPIDLYCQAHQIRAAGLSLNMLCQNLADQQLTRLVQDGVQVLALFLQPGGEAMRRREIEERISPDHLSTLTSLNIDMLLRVRSELGEDALDKVVIGTYDETIRFNITLIDDDLCITQPYLPRTRGIDSPTFIIRRDSAQPGLYDVFDDVFRHLAEQSTLL